MFIASAANISGAVRTSGQLTCDVSLNFFVRSSEPRVQSCRIHKHLTPIGVRALESLTV